MDELVKTKAADDFYDDVHFRRAHVRDTTLCGLKITERAAVGDVTCLRCREFADGDF